MTLLKTINENEATGVVKKVYERFTLIMGKVPNVIKLHSASTTTFPYILGLLNEFAEHPNLDREILTYLRIIIPHRNNGEYCVALQSAIIKSMGVSETEIETAKNNPENLPLDEKRKTLLLFAVDVIEGYYDNIETRLEKLRTLGWTDQEIYEMCFLGSFQKGMIPLINAFKVKKDF